MTFLHFFADDQKPDSPNWTEISAIVAVAGALLSIFFFYATRTLTYNAEKVKIICWCIDQYYQIKKARADKQLTTEREEWEADINYLEHLWGLHYSQYQFYKLRILPPNIYATWLYLRHQQFTSKVPEKQKLETEGWETAMKDIADQDFVTFVNSIHDTTWTDPDQALKFIRSKISREWGLFH